MLPMLILLPVELAGVALEVGLDVGEQLVDLDGVGLEGDLVAVAEAEIDDGLLAGRLRAGRLEAAPVADDLVEPLLAVVVRRRRRTPRWPSPGVGGLDVLPAVLVIARPARRGPARRTSLLPRPAMRW